MAEEKKKDEKPVDAASTGEATSKSLQDEAPETPQKPAKPVEPADEAKPAESAKSAAGAKPTGEATSESLQDKAPETPQEPAKPAEPDWKDLYARLRADFDNFKKRTARDREDTYRYAEADILKDILPTVDNLALALANATTGVQQQDGAKPEGEATPSPRQDKDGSASAGRGGDAASTKGATLPAFVTGVQLVYDNLVKSLKDHGAEPFDCVGQPLDTEKMEAIATLPSALVEEGKVSNEVKRGWMLKDKVLRVAQVVVSSGKPA